MTIEQTTGTAVTQGQGGNAQGATGTGSEGAAGGNAATEPTDAEIIAKLREEKQQHLAEKSTLERTKVENELLMQRIEAMTLAPPTAPAVDSVQANVQAKYQELVARAYQGDPDAQFQLAMYHGQQQSFRQVQVQSALNAVPADVRGDVETLLLSNPALDVPTAQRIAQGDRSEKRLKEIETREAEDKRRTEEAARAGAGGATTVRPAPASELKTGTMKASEFASRLRQLKEKADGGDVKARNEALALGRQVDKGEVVLILNQ